MRLLVSALAAIMIAAMAMAEQVFVRLTAFPSVAVADGSTPVTITAAVRDRRGKLVADGTRIKFSTNLGSLDETIVATSGGVARTTLRANGVAGFATVTVSALEDASTPSVLEYEFVADRKLLSSAREYIELFSPTYMQYTVDTRMVGAAGPDRGVFLRYRDVEIRADDLQLDVYNYEVRARNAHVKFGAVDQVFAELNFRLNARQGLGTARYEGLRADFIASYGGITFAGIQEGDKILPPQTTSVFGVVELRTSGVKPVPTLRAAGLFAFQDLSSSPSTISAQKATIFPKREVQFQRAEIYVAGMRLLKMPLFQLSYMTGNNSPIITDQLVSVNDNQLAINYPHYLTLKPGLTSMLRFRTGERYGRGTGVSNGAFLDYEMEWNRGDEMQGGLTFSGIARNDWTIGLKQYSRISPKTTFFAQAETPANRGIYGSGSLNHQFDGFSLNFNASASRTLRGLPSSSNTTSVDLSSNPHMVIPKVRFSYGINATQQANSNSLGSRRTSTYGIRTRAYSSPIPLDRSTQFYSEFTAERFLGSDDDRKFAIGGSATVTRAILRDLSVATTLFYTQDGYNDELTGRYRLSHDLNFFRGRTSLSASMSRSLDIDNVYVFGNFDYMASRDWRLRADYTHTRYVGLDWVDYNFTVGFRIPGTWREVGLVWSRQTNRIGFQFLSVGY